MSALLIPEAPLQVLPSLAKRVGLQEALFLQQVHYLAQRQAERDRCDVGQVWIRKTVEQWREWPFNFMGKRTLERLIAKLREADLVVAEADENSFDRTLRYRINYDSEAFRQDGGNGPAPRGSSSRQVGGFSRAQGRQLKTPDTKVRESFNAGVGIREVVARFGGKPVPEARMGLALAVLATFNVQTNLKLPAFNGKGEPSENLKRILGRATEWPDLSLEDHQRIIRNCLANPWWQGQPTIGVIYGPNVWENSMSNDGVARLPRVRNIREARMAEDDAMNARLRATIMGSVAS